ncbi:diguanylate cyclase domain-containing protein [Ramlibacter albus]|uniref:Diguanylate cyclase n=1 Tax=Ramlibacter albus TaxID=2079448 RepID=A0A923MC62_9BURK|nr:diguanylate cyclase [Ramlibacter albus]MBC5766708.1 diguanylate cyclase [Ramlibacter albus]
MNTALLPAAALVSAFARVAAALQGRSPAAREFLDTTTGLGNHGGLAGIGQPMLDAARRDGRPFSIVVLDFSELTEVREIYGTETARRVVQRVVRKLRLLAGPRGAALRTGRTEFTVLLPGANRDAACAAVHRVLGKPSRVEFDAGDCEIVLVPEIVADNVANDGESLVEVHDEISRGLAKARHDEMRRVQWLQRERERHSRPMALPA